MSPEKYVQLILKLAEKTSEGKIPWRKTADSQSFIAPLSGKFKITIRELSSYGEHLVNITDSTGDVIETISADDLRRYATIAKVSLPAPEDILNRTFTTARRQALGVDKAIDSLLTALDQKEIKDDDDEIPF